MVPSLPFAFRRFSGNANLSSDVAPATIAAFRSVFDSSARSFRRIGILIGLFLYTGWGLFDYAMIPQVDRNLFWMIRFMTILPLGLWVIATTFLSPESARVQPWVAFLVALAGAGMCVMARLSPTSVEACYMGGILVITVATYTLFRFLFFWAAVTGWLICLTFLLLVYPRMGMSPSFITWSFLMVSANICGMIGVFVMETHAFRDFLHTRMLAKERERVGSANQSLEDQVRERTAAYQQKVVELEKSIARQNAVESVLRDSEAQYRSLLESVEEACFETDLEGRFQFFNSAVSRIVGQSMAEVSKTELFTFLDTASSSRVRSLMKEMARTGGPAVSIPVTVVAKGGETVPLSLTLTVMMDPEGSKTGFRGIGRDVSRERSLESALAEARESVREADIIKLRFVTNMSHELRTPMTGVLGATHLLSESGLNPEQSTHITTISEATEMMLAVLDDIQDYTRMATGDFLLRNEIFVPELLLAEVCKPFLEQAQAASIQLSWEAEGVPGRLEGDVARLRQVLENLLDNAVKYTETGEVKIRFFAREEGDDIRLIATVMDTGRGIPESKIADLFDTFYRINPTRSRKFGGSGLGLSISRMIAERMGGNLRIRSIVGRGTTVTCDFLLSRVSGAPALTVIRTPEPQVTAERKKAPRVLLVEDNLINQKITLKLLEKIGCETDLAENGVEALEKLRNHSYEMVFMDVQMPEMDGLTATRKIREGACGDTAGGIPIVAFTAHATKGDREACLGAGMDDFLTKPVKPELLRSMVDKWGRLT